MSEDNFCHCGAYKLLSTRGEHGNLEGKHRTPLSAQLWLGRAARARHAPSVGGAAVTPFAPIMDDMTRENCQLPTQIIIATVIETRWEKLVIKSLIWVG